jgi:hypothetical protein
MGPLGAERGGSVMQGLAACAPRVLRDIPSNDQVDQLRTSLWTGNGTLASVIERRPSQAALVSVAHSRLALAVRQSGHRRDGRRPVAVSKGSWISGSGCPCSRTAASGASPAAPRSPGTVSSSASPTSATTRTPWRSSCPIRAAPNTYTSSSMPTGSRSTSRCPTYPAVSSGTGSWTRPSAPRRPLRPAPATHPGPGPVHGGPTLDSHPDRAVRATGAG